MNKASIDIDNEAEYPEDNGASMIIWTFQGSVFMTKRVAFLQVEQSYYYKKKSGNVIRKKH